MYSSIFSAHYPLTSPQREIWFDQMLHEGIPLYNIGGYVKIPGRVDTELFEQAVNLLIQKHDTLRTVLAEETDEEGIPLQGYADALAVNVAVQDFSTETHPHEAAMAWMRQRFVEPFVLKGQPLFRYDLVKVSDECYYWLLQYHHLIIDGFGVALLNRSLAKMYTQLAQGETPNLDSLSYTDFVTNDRTYVESKVFDKQKRYWLDKYPTAPAPLLTPRYRAQYTNNLIGSGCETLYLPRDFYNQLAALAKQQGGSLFHLLLGALTVYFTRINGREDFAIGLPVLNRANAQFKQTAGLFTGVSPTVFQVERNCTFAELLQHINKTLKANYRHQRFPVSEINRAVGLGVERSQLFDVSLSFENHDYDSFFTEVNAQAVPLLNHYEKTPLIIFVREFHTKADVKFDFVFNLAYFKTEDIKALQARFVTVLKAILQDSSTPLHTLPVMTEAERKRLIEWNDTATDYPQNQTIVSLFEQQVEQTPDNIAVVFEEEQLTYRQLNENANRLAHHLVSMQSFTDHYPLIPNNRLIAICVEHSLNMVIGLLGILKAGGAYVPIDPSYPQARIQYLLEDISASSMQGSNAPILLTQSQLKEQLPATAQDCQVVCLDEVDFERQPTANLEITRNPNDLAYVIYTSGSTGMPKGVMVEHRNLINLCHWHCDRFSIQATDKATLVANTAFDASVWELWPYLISGACVLPTHFKSLLEAGIWQWFNTKGITVSFLPTPMIEHNLLATMPEITQLRYLLTGGDKLHQCPDLPFQLINNYGPTENTVVTTSTLVKPDESPSIGYPISNTRIYILDSQQQPLPPGIPGELCISGHGLARGYLNRPKLTAEKFLEIELFGKKERIYKTGDLARWLPDGNLEYLGRIDHQIKLRGFRIELGEIEALLSQHESVNEAVVILYEHEGNQSLAAYVVVSGQWEANHSSLMTELREYLKTRLPDYMIPASFTVLDKLPLTPNGKIDRKALPAPSQDTVTSGTQPLTPTEDLLASLWAGVLKREVIQREDNFFELGGHSLLATQLVSRIREAFQVELPIRAIFETPQLNQLATQIDNANRETRLPPIVKQAAAAPTVLSFAQQRLWFLHQFEDETSATYNMPATLRLEGELNQTALQQSLYWLIERHHSLRTFFPMQDGQAQVRVLAMDNLTALTHEDLTALSADEQAQTIQTQANQHATAPFDLTNGPLFKAKLLQLNDNQAVLLLNLHHIISDGWSMGVFIRDWQQAYTAFASGEPPNKPPLEIQYSDYAVWQRNWLQGKTLQQQLDYWQSQLAGIPELLELPTDKPRPPQQSYQGAHYSHALPAGLSQAINRLSHEQGVSLFMTLLAAFDILLSRYSRQDDFCIGSPIANRTHQQTEDLIGFFVNTLVLRTQLNPDLSFTELLRQTRKTCLSAYAHQDIPFEMLVEQLHPTRSLSHSPLFQVMLVLQNNEGTELTLPDVNITALTPDYPIAKFDVTLGIEDRNGQLHCQWEYATDLFKADTIQRMAGHFAQLLTTITENPTQAIGQLSILTNAEIQQLQTWNDTQTDYPQDQTIVSLFEQQVEQTPENIAVVFEEEQLTYRQLNHKANQLAHHLLSLQNSTDHYPLIPNHRLIAICVERSLNMVIGLLGILKANGAYVPIDPSYPQARIQYLLEDSNTPILLTQSHLKDQLPATSQDCQVVCLDEVDFEQQLTANLEINRNPNDLAYVIYTSGSTGKPKGCQVTHTNVTRLFDSTEAWYHFNKKDIWTLFHSYAFDFSVWEIWGALFYGAKLVIVPYFTSRNPTEFYQLLIKEQVTVLNQTPSAFGQLIKLDTQPEKLSLRLVIFGGEALDFNRLRTWFAQHSDAEPQLVNMYGVTETTVHVTYYPVTSQLHYSNVIGVPLPDLHIWVVDAYHQPQPIGVPGEILVGGAGVTHGYLNRPELTAEKFIEIEFFGKKERIYKTGDLARRLPDGNLEYLGRIDHQIKLRGFRIELGEIEAVLSQHEAVKEAIVVLYEADDNKRLIAYVTQENCELLMVNGELQDNCPLIIHNASFNIELKDWLKIRLPDYMVPAQFVVLDKLPLIPNGKIDRKALPAPEWQLTKTYAPPRNEIEQQLASIWSQLLKVDNVGIHDNFFELGGDSILSIQIVAKARQAGLQLSPRDIFEHQTLVELADAVRFETATVAEQGLVTGTVPLIPIQHWFFAQQLPEAWHFNQSVLLQVPVDLNLEALQQAFALVLSHHDALRSRYQAEDGQWQQETNSSTDSIPFAMEDLTSAENPLAELTRITQHYQQAFDLSAGPLTHLVFLHWPDQARLFWCIHHLVVDGVSWRILIEDLHTAYQQIIARQTPQLPAKTTSFKAWAERLVAYADSETVLAEYAYWQARPNRSLPIDHPQGENRLEHTQSQTLTLSREATEALLKQVPVAYNTRINDVLLTALALTLQQWTGQAECVIDLEGHGRVDLFPEMDLSRTVGWFTTVHPVALTVTRDLGDTLKIIKEQLRAVPKDGIGYGLLTQICGKTLPKGDILFNYLGQFDADSSNKYFQFANEVTGQDVSLKGQRDHLLEINGAVMQGQLFLTWSYSSACYQSATIQKLVSDYQQYLTAIIQHCQTYAQNRPSLESCLSLKSGSNTQVTLFCLPGLGSKAGYFLSLANALNTIPLVVYGLESPGLDGIGKIPQTVEELAKFHLERIKWIQPQGPYYLIGHSFGSVVALEIAWQLEQAGEVVALLAIFDQPTPQLSPQEQDEQSQTDFDYLWNIVCIFEVLAGMKPHFDLGALKKTENLNDACEVVMDWFKSNNAHEILFSSSGLTEELTCLVKVYQANALAFPAYQPHEKQIKSEIHLFCTADSIETWGSGLPDDWGWQQHTSAGVTDHQVTGTHVSMIKPPHVQGLADKLSKLIKAIISVLG